jgi:hypothetical protein
MAHKIKVSEEYVDSLCSWLDEWSSKDDSYCIPQFLAKYGIPWKHLEQLMRQHSALDSCFSIVEARLHARWIQMAFDKPQLSRHLSAIMFRYLKVYDCHAFKVDCDRKKEIADNTPVTLQVYEVEDYKNLPLQGEFKKIYERNDNKRRSEPKAE